MNRHLGSGFNVYRGLPYQKGYGLGGGFRRFFRWIVPIFKKHALPVLKSTAKVIGNEALSSVSNISKDIINGNNIADSVQSRLNEAVDNLKTKAEDTLEGRGFEKTKSISKRILMDSERRRRNYLNLTITDFFLLIN